MDTRAEGVYCWWESYPPETREVKDNIFHVDRVNGDQSVTSFECARDETVVIARFLNGIHKLDTH